MIKGSNGDTLRARWSFDGTKLRFTDFSFTGAYRLVWASEPWVLSRYDAPAQQPARTTISPPCPRGD